MNSAVLLFPLTSLRVLRENALYPFEISEEKREIDHSPLGTVYLLSSPAGALSYPIETMKLTLVSRPRCSEN